MRQLYFWIGILGGEFLRLALKQNLKKVRTWLWSINVRLFTKQLWMWQSYDKVVLFQNDCAKSWRRFNVESKSLPRCSKPAQTTTKVARKKKADIDIDRDISVKAHKLLQKGMKNKPVPTGRVEELRKDAEHHRHREQEIKHMISAMWLPYRPMRRQWMGSQQNVKVFEPDESWLGCWDTCTTFGSWRSKSDANYRLSVSKQTKLHP